MNFIEAIKKSIEEKISLKWTNFIGAGFAADDITRVWDYQEAAGTFKMQREGNPKTYFMSFASKLKDQGVMNLRELEELLKWAEANPGELPHPVFTLHDAIKNKITLEERHKAGFLRVFSKGVRQDNKKRLKIFIKNPSNYANHERYKMIFFDDYGIDCQYVAGGEYRLEVADIRKRICSQVEL
jgi:hypothetical protein